MACFCKTPMATAPSAFAAMNLKFSPPKIPLQMHAALSLGGGGSLRLDMQIAAFMQSLRLPSFSLNGGLMAQLKIALGMFDLFDIPKLMLQLKMGTESLQAHALPALSFLAKLNLSALLQLAMVARLQLALDALKINLAAGMPPVPTSFSFNPHFALKPPQLQLGTMILGIPIAMKFSETLGVPVNRMSSHFAALAKIKPPQLGISVNAMLKMCMALDAIATIQAAFGANALSPSGLSGIAAKLKLYAGLPIPDIPLPPLALNAKLDGLPSLDALSAGVGALPAGGLTLQLPNIPILPMLNLMAALNACINLNFPGACKGGCPFG
ncbi:MAG: hypothetical protein AAGC57_11720 [Pseudomonadota bacterium]